MYRSHLYRLLAFLLSFFAHNIIHVTFNKCYIIVLEYSTLTGILSGIDVRPLYDSVWLLALTWPGVNEIACLLAH